MARWVEIAWYRFKDGEYRLKSVVIYEDGRARDSLGTFTDEDAHWLTEALGGTPAVELQSYQEGDTSLSDYPVWAKEPNG